MKEERKERETKEEREKRENSLTSLSVIFNSILSLIPASNGSFPLLTI